LRLKGNSPVRGVKNRNAGLFSFRNISDTLRFSPGKRNLSSNSNKEFLSPTIAIAIYIDEANPMPQNWEKEE